MILDTEKIFTGYDPRYIAKYGLYTEEAKTVTDVEAKHGFKIVWSDGAACLARLLTLNVKFGKHNNGKKPNRLIVELNFDIVSNKKLVLTEEERMWWIEVCKEHNLLPSNIDEFSAKTGRLCFDITSLSDAGIYLYFCAARIMQETPQVVKNMLYLVKEKQLDFYIALLISHRFGVNNSGHSMLNTYRIYGESFKPLPKVESVEIDLRDARGVRIAAEKIKTRTISGPPKFSAWGLQDLIRNEGQKSNKIKIKDSNKPEALSFVYSEEV